MISRRRATNPIRKTIDFHLRLLAELRKRGNGGPTERKDPIRHLFLGQLVAAHDTGRLQFFGDHAHLTERRAFAAYLVLASRVPPRLLPACTRAVAAVSITKRKEVDRRILRLPPTGVDDFGADRLQHRREAPCDGAKSDQPDGTARQLAKIVRQGRVEGPAFSSAGQTIEFGQTRRRSSRR